MSTRMRRQDRAMKASREMELFLEQGAVGRLALTTKDGPYVVPVNYLFNDGNIYFHTAVSGRKVESIQADARVCFLVDEVGPQVLWDRGCGISQIYRSVLCFGKAEFLEDPTQKRAILEKMVQKYVPSSYPLSPIKDQNIQMTAVVRIVIETMSGKAHELSSSHTVLSNRFRPQLFSEGQQTPAQ